MRVGAHITDDGRSPRQLVEAVGDVAALGSFHHVWVNQGPGGPDPLSLLAAAGRVGGPDFELGTAIVPSYPRHPVNLAATALTVQELTGGRLTLGIGPGHRSFVEDGLGLSYAAPASHTEEYLRVLRPLLRGESVEHRGEQLTAVGGLDISGATPPRLLLSALGPRMLRLAGSLADGAIATWVRPGLVADHFVPRLTAAAPEGVSPRVVVVALVGVTAEPERTRAGIAERFAGAAGLPPYRAVLALDGLTSVAETAVLGSEEEVVRELDRFQEAGTTDLLAVPWGSPAAQERTLTVLGEVARRTVTGP